MYSIDVFGAFDFLENEIKIGTLSYERTRGSSAYRFAFEPGYFNKYGNLLLSHDIGYFLGVQAKSKGIFACFGDAMPDRWGKALIDKRERILGPVTFLRHQSNQRSYSKLAGDKEFQRILLD